GSVDPPHARFSVRDDRGDFEAGDWNIRCATPIRFNCSRHRGVVSLDGGRSMSTLEKIAPEAPVQEGAEHLSGRAAGTKNVSVATEADRIEWDAFAAAHPDAVGYHDWAWRLVFTGAFGHEPIYLIAREAGRVVGLLPLVYVNSFLFGRAMISLPFLNY